VYVKHPLAYSRRLADGADPAQEHEPLTADDLALESVMLRLRLAEGVPTSAVAPGKADAIARLIASELIDGTSAVRGLLVLTRKGRLLADAAVRALT